MAHIGLGLGLGGNNGQPPLILISDFQVAPPTAGFNSQTLQGTGASIARAPSPELGVDNQSCRFIAGPKSGETVGKAHLTFNTPALVPEGKTIRTGFHLYLSSGSQAPWDGQKIFDLENNTIINNPGIRLAIYDTGGNRGVTFERFKLGLPTFIPQVIAQGLTLNTWHYVTTSVTLGDDTTGRVQVWLNGALVLDATGMTIMTQAYWDSLGGGSTITPGATSLQFGATANSDTTKTCTVHMDNIGYRVG